MKGMVIGALLGLVILSDSCCSKKGSCPALQFQSFELNGFSKEEVTDSVNLIRYDRKSSFTVVLDTSFLKGEATDDTAKFKVQTQELSPDFDYALQIVKLGKLYRINNFTVEKVTCGKCFMRSNNQFGYTLNGYSVNNRPQAYDGIIRIAK